MRPMPLHQRFTPAPLALAAALALALAAGHAPPAHAQGGAAAAPGHAATPSVDVNIPAQPLGPALNELARQANLQMTFPAEWVAGKQAPAVAGKMTAQQALDRMLAGSGLIAVAQGANVVIQRAPEQAESGARPQYMLPTVTVTGTQAATTPTQQKERGYRVERSSAASLTDRPVLDTPYSISTFTSEVLADVQARSLQDYVHLEPSVTLNFPTFDDSVSIRGLNVASARRDGMRITRQVRTPLENKASVEFLRGLNGFRYGFNDVGGVVSYTVKRPTAEPLTSLTLSADSHGSVGAHLDASRRFGTDDQFGVRINAMGEEFKSYIDNVDGPRRLFSLFADWRVTPGLTLEFDYEYFRDRRPSPGLALWSFESLEAARAILPLIQPNMSTAQPWFPEDRDYQNVSARAEYRFSSEWKGTLALMQSTANIPYRGLDPSNVQANGDYTLGSYNIEVNRQKNIGLFSALTGTYWAAGLKNELALALSVDQQENRGSDILLLTMGPANLFRSQVLPPGFTVVNNFGAWSRDQDWQTLVANNTLHLNDRWQLLTGLTYASLKSSNPRSSYRDSAVSPTLAVVHKLTPKTSAYASYATALEQGGTASAPASNAGRVMPALKSKQVEVGVKHELAHGGLVTLAAFEINKGLEYINSAQLYVQDGRQVHRGIEATLSGQITRDLRLHAGLTWLDPTIEKAAENVGNRPAGVARLQAGLFADLHVPAIANRFHLTGSVHAASDKFVNGANTFSVPGYAVYGIGARYSHGVGSKLMTYRLGIDNLFDKRYFNSVGAYEGLYFGATRTVKASITVDF